MKKYQAKTDFAYFKDKSGNFHKYSNLSHKKINKLFFKNQYGIFRSFWAFVK